jgi:hypothetical protein
MSQCICLTSRLKYKTYKQSGIVVCYNPSTLEAKTEGSWVGGQSGLHSEWDSEKKKHWGYSSVVECLSNVSTLQHLKNVLKKSVKHYFKTDTTVLLLDPFMTFIYILVLFIYNQAFCFYSFNMAYISPFKIITS